MEAEEYPPYLGAQVVGALLAALAVLALGLGPDTAGEIEAAPQALLAEFLFTFALAFVMLNVATAAGTEGNSFYGLAIGFTVFAGAVAVGPVSGGAFNPAVAVGASVFGAFAWSNIWIYLVANFAGGAAAAFAFLFVNPAEKRGGDVRAGDPDDARQSGDGATMGASDLHSRRD